MLIDLRKNPFVNAIVAFLAMFAVTFLFTFTNKMTTSALSILQVPGQWVWPLMFAAFVFVWRRNNPFVPAAEETPAEDKVHTLLTPWQGVVLSMLGEAIWMLNKILYVAVGIAKKAQLPQIELELEAKFPSRRADETEGVQAEGEEKK